MRSAAITLAPAQYYIGIIGADRGLDLGAKVLKEWSLQSYTSQPTRFAFTLANNMQDIAAYDPANIVNNKIQVLSDGPGLVVNKTPQPARQGFFSSFSWRPANCVSDAAGFTFFLTTTGPSDIVLSPNVTDAGYGTDGLSTLTAISYFAAQNKFTAYFGKEIHQVTFC